MEHCRLFYVGLHPSCIAKRLLHPIIAGKISCSGRQICLFVLFGVGMSGMAFFKKGHFYGEHRIFCEKIPPVHIFFSSL